MRPEAVLDVGIKRSQMWDRWGSSHTSAGKRWPSAQDKQVIMSFMAKLSAVAFVGMDQEAQRTQKKFN